MSNTYVCLSSFDNATIEKLSGLAEKAGAALVKSANATRQFFAMFPDCVGNVAETQGVLSHLDGFADFGKLKKDSDKFIQTFAGLDNALRKGTAEISKGKVLWRGASYSHKHCLFAIALCEAARKQAGKKGDTATVVKKKASREELAALISDLIALCDEHAIRDDRRYGKLVDKWLEMEV